MYLPRCPPQGSGVAAGYGWSTYTARVPSLDPKTMSLYTYGQGWPDSNSLGFWVERVGAGQLPISHFVMVDLA